ncbi:hypothetical protein LMG33818_000663 [Halomonadaceae bacterium LMG 33818]|uniref:DUF3549 family protein n=1 Tax=Cernens ardua TaxID=3402176 RepID=UPI003EDC93BA
MNDSPSTSTSIQTSIPGTLSDFFEQAQLDYSIYNIGRRVAAVSKHDFRTFEEIKSPWATPVKATARLALMLRAKAQPAEEAVIWCIALPLDEQGLLIPNARDTFLHRLLEQLGTRPQGEALQDPLKDNPLAFRPDNYALAALHALASRDNGLPESKGMAMARAYYSGDGNTNGQPIDWASLDYQSVADLCLALTPALEERIAKQLPMLPDAPLEALCRMLEHFPTNNEPLQKALLARGKHEEHQRINVLRAILSGQSEIAANTLDHLLNETLSVEELAVISAKGWQLLEHEERLSAYLNALAVTPSIDFIACIKDLAQLARLRLPVIMMLQQASDGSVLKNRLQASLGQ